MNAIHLFILISIFHPCLPVSTDSTTCVISGHHKHIIMSPHTSDAFRGTKEMLAQVRYHQQSIGSYISVSPSTLMTHIWSVTG